ncbi:MAG: HAD-IA family hydrolase [Acidimicrobiales bacterium]
MRGQFPTPAAVLWDFGGVLTTSPFGAFADYEREQGLPPGFLRRLNATNPDTNAWAALERGEVTIDEFATLFEEEAAAAGGRVDAHTVLDCLGGQLRPAMVEALRRCHERLKTGLLTNNFTLAGGGEDPLGYAPVLSMFDVVVESSAAGCRKPDSKFYEMACELLAIEPAEAVFLDDLGINLKPARQMGMRTIKVEDPDLAIRELEAVVGFRLAGNTGAGADGP